MAKTKLKKSETLDVSSLNDVQGEPAIGSSENPHETGSEASLEVSLLINGNLYKKYATESEAYVEIRKLSLCRPDDFYEVV
jgi:hypothetical protein